ncbi:MAG: DNA repair protein RecO [Candidatus Kerfeldbacteria bacterium RIFCSPLOWO2_01_FULL_48_11]|uniref:DNA repair protein RecO n=1 Tax=Candidatus Kerfeldbacteria bacterium RIFCSPLOWO2_01_FULL_48_11 TaxID=1798543 RepID=A0A1G2B4S1_9BACT|nr:MAG: repair protein RecO protein [Parcubacteria group bacterium GW2011_GWA2_48_9]KKW15550.1 MAG: repair protein RecO protein [Parcubacteria group bacterium GW2011_GWC2_49_9]OGY83639.1 MAG: DNA repair protein RecO [Candidatus Kerfeldbacteria bacterium RIFCSPLOWO2_01_FULL_48_11]HCM67623.1 DNA repair protein RecO [Candidatus Kerfeldbacteria bacterium]
MSTFHTEGVVLSHAQTTGTDRIVTLYTVRMGKLRVRLRGGLKSASKLSGSFEPFTAGTFFFAHGRGGVTAIGADVVSTHKILKRDLARIASASVCAEVVVGLTHEHHADPRIFELIISACGVLNRTSVAPITVSLVPVWFLWNALKLLGTGFEEQSCVRCRKRLTPTSLGISFSLGGMLCGPCRSQVHDALSLSTEAVKTIRFTLNSNASTLARLRLPQRALRELMSLSENMYAYQSERASTAFIFFRAFQA